jgi:hypothetical protein
MSVVERKVDLFEGILRLRRAGRATPSDTDISAARSALERELGPTVSRRMAASVLGVSHTALARWVAAGDLPVVFTPAGRLEVPVPALLDLRESVDADRAAGLRRYPLAPTMRRRRDAAQRLRVRRERPGELDGAHARASAVGLAYHRAVANRLRKPMVTEARHVLSCWREEGRIDEQYAARWEQLLDQPVAAIRAALVREDPDADGLRQNSPFAGLLSEPERRRILSEDR